MNITICGGGSLGHVCAGVLSSREDVYVSILTTHPDRWAEELVVTDEDGRTYKGTPVCITDDPSVCIPSAEMVLFCLPGFAIREQIERIRPYLSLSTSLGSIVSSTGFFFFAHELLPANQALFGFQRTPFIARTAEYGHSARLLGYKKSVSVATENIPDVESFRQLIERLFLTPADLLSSFYEAALTNSNPILHTGRLYAMWNDWKGEATTECCRFYAEWDTPSAEMIIRMDEEFQHLLAVLPLDKSRIPTLLSYYEQPDAESLAAKLRSIPAFVPILAPMKQVPAGWIPDFGSRYFTEDFPFGLRFIHDLAHEHNISCPTIDIVYEWGLRMIENNVL